MAPVRFAEGAHIDYRDANYPGRIGWHEVILRGVDGLALADTTAPTNDETDELRIYPTDPTRAPLDVSAARATTTLGGVSSRLPTAESLRRVAVAAAPLDRVPEQLTAI